MQSKIHTLDRRAVLTGTAATAAALAATTLPAEPAPAETIHDRMERIAKEMAVAIDDWIDGWASHVPGVPRPVWHAEIWPLSSGGFYGLKQDRQNEPPLEAARRHLHLAAEAMNRNQPGKYRVEMTPEGAFAVIIDDTWTKARI